jgi:hypothetical protein
MYLYNFNSESNNWECVGISPGFFNLSVYFMHALKYLRHIPLVEKG